MTASESERAAVTLDEIASVGEQLRQALSDVLATLPESERTADKLAKRFPIDGAAARRIVRTVNAPSHAEAIARAPGIKALRKLAQASNSDTLTAAIADLDALIKKAGPSKAALTTIVRDARDAGELPQ